MEIEVLTYSGRSYPVPGKYAAKGNGHTGWRIPSCLPFSPDLSQPVQQMRSDSGPNLFKWTLYSHANRLRTHQEMEGECARESSNGSCSRTSGILGFAFG